jgi:hypothetical protein
MEVWKTVMRPRSSAVFCSARLAQFLSNDPLQSLEDTIAVYGSAVFDIKAPFGLAPREDANARLILSGAGNTYRVGIVGPVIYHVKGGCTEPPPKLGDGIPYRGALRFRHVIVSTSWVGTTQLSRQFTRKNR